MCKDFFGACHAFKDYIQNKHVNINITTISVPYMKQ